MERTLKQNNVHVLKRSLEVGFYVIVFAVALPAFFYLLGNSMDRIINPFHHSMTSLLVAGVTLFGLGGSFMVMAVFNLWKFGKGLPASPAPPKILVENGIYRLSRHPIYFGASLSFLGASLFLHSFWSAFLSWPLFTLFFVSYALRVEEPFLERRFGKEYHFYKRHVPLLWEFPLRKAFHRLISRFLSRISRVVNEPFILKYRTHYLFLGYGMWVGFGVFVGLIVLNVILLAEKISAFNTSWLMFFFTVASLSGSRFVSLLVVRVQEKITIKKAWYRVGFVSWGVLAAAFLSSGLFIILAQRSLYVWFDAAFTGLMIVYFFGRIGCLFYGCCYGKKAHSPIHINYSHPCLKAVREGLVKTKALYPTQLFSSLYGLFIFIIVIAVWNITTIRIGVPASICCIMYGIFRFIEEWYRYQKRLIAGIFSPAQFVCLALILLGSVHLAWILPFINPGFHQPLSQLSLKEVFNQLNIFLIIGMGLLTIIVLSYHRYEIGMWGREKELRKPKTG